MEPTPLVPLSDDAAGVGVLLAPLLEEPGVLVVADPAAVPEVAVDVAPDVSADVPVAAELATPATSVAPRAAPAVATPAAVNVARRNTRFGRLGVVSLSCVRRSPGTTHRSLSRPSSAPQDRLGGG